MKLTQLQQEFATKETELKGLLRQEALSAEETTKAEGLVTDLERLKGEIQAEQAAASKAQDLRSRAQTLTQWAGERPQVPLAPAVDPQPGAAPAAQFQGGAEGLGQPLGYATASAGHAQPRLSGSGRAGAFMGRYDQKLKRWIGPDESAHRFGMWFLATSLRSEKAQKYCRDQGIPLMAVLAADGRTVDLAHATNINATGGYLVPEEFEADLIVLKEEYGVFRRNAKVSRMRGDTKMVPRRTGGLTAYFVGEGVDGTESEKGWDRVRLTARKLMCLAKYSNELDEDAVIDIGNDLAEEMAYAFSLKEDECGFNGDGTATYDGIVGVRAKLKGLSSTIANIAGLVVASGNAYSEILLGDFNKVKARLPRYARKGNVKWFCSQGFYHEVMEKLALASGGVTAAEIAAGRNQEFFMGYPVEIAQVLPATEENSQVCCLFGDLRMAALFGDRRQSTIALSEHAAFESDELKIRGTERFDINVHDVGNESATAALRKPGPIVGLITAAG